MSDLVLSRLRLAVAQRSFRYVSRSHAGVLPGLALACGLAGLALPAQAGVYQLYASTLVNASSFVPLPGDVDYHALRLDYLNQPQARSLQRLDDEAHAGGGSASARFLGQMGMLKAYASASYPYCCVDGRALLNGYANASVGAGFYDTLLVWGAGLAVGTPVSYTVTMRIDGTLSEPDFEMGGYLSGYGQALVRLIDLTTREEVWDRWYADQDDPGLYSLTLNTQVGREIAIGASLDVGAYVSAYATTGRWVEADFYSSAHFNLTPSVQGLNTTGSSGFDFAPAPSSQVAEPATASLLLAGLGLMGWLRTRRVVRQPGSPTA